MQAMFARLAGRADWLASPLMFSTSALAYGVPTGAELRAQRARQAAADAERAGAASEELRAELRRLMSRARRDGIRHGPAPVAAEVRKFAAGLARRLCTGASMRGRAHVRTAREGYRRAESAPKWWGDYRAQCADEIEAALWHHAGALLGRAGVGARAADELVLRAVRSRAVVVRALRAGERVLRRMSHRHRDADGADRLGGTESGTLAPAWVPAAEQVAQLREAIIRGARNAPTAARLVALLHAIISRRPPTGPNAARTVGRMLAAAAAGGYAEPVSWRAYCGARVGGRPATVTA